MKSTTYQDEFNPLQMSRRHFLSRSAMGIGVAALSSLLPGCSDKPSLSELALDSAIKPQHLAKAKRVIYLFQSGGPAQMELFDYKPFLNEMKLSFDFNVQ